MAAKVSIILLLAVVLFACNVASGPGGNRSSADPSAPAQVDVSTSTAEVRANVRILSEDEGAAALVDASSVAFPLEGYGGLATLAVGTVLVSTSKGGFLRRIDAVIPSTTRDGAIHKQTLGELYTVFQTSIASLADVFFNLDTSVVVAPSPLSVDETIELGNASFKVTLGQVKVDVAPKLTLALKLERGEPLRMSADVTVDLKLALQAGLAAEANFAVKDDRELWRSAPIPVNFSLGPVPIISAIRFAIIAHAKADAKARVTAGFNVACTRTVTTHLLWEKEGGASTAWDRAESCDSLPSPDYRGDALSVTEGFSTHSDVSIELRAEWNFFSLASISVGAEAHAKQSIEQCPPPAQYTLTRVLTAKVGADFRPFGIPVATYEKEVLSDEKEIRRVAVFDSQPANILPPTAFRCPGCVKDKAPVDPSGFYSGSVHWSAESPLTHPNDNNSPYYREEENVPLYADLAKIDDRRFFVNFAVDAPATHAVDIFGPQGNYQETCLWGIGLDFGRARPNHIGYCSGANAQSKAGDPACAASGPLVKSFVAESFQVQDGTCVVGATTLIRGDPSKSGGEDYSIFEGFILEASGRLACGLLDLTPALQSLNMMCPVVCPHRDNIASGIPGLSVSASVKLAR